MVDLFISKVKIVAKHQIIGENVGTRIGIFLGIAHFFLIPAGFGERATSALSLVELPSFSCLLTLFPISLHYFEMC